MTENLATVVSLIIVHH